ncbi:ABC transporter ATP-binding protein [Streptomyces collinus]|uniref:ABC transporter ATP-binding protein n=1 Tax=Streptomyces collinus TaxID=42684 RepID=UPI00294399E1|nr:ABC transporter ATP-binding protein [Streptomyces collinus]
MTAVVEVRDAHVVHKARSGGLFTRDRVYALTGADLTVAPGETVGVVGESGCGKSTLAKVLVGIQRPTSGTVSFQGRDLWSMPPAERRAVVGAGTGMIFQDPSTALNRRLTVRRILRDPLDVHGRGTRAGREERVRELMALVGLPRALADALPGQLSGGQRQRVAIARALALDPGLVVADEPTSALDVSVRAQILNLLLDLGERLDLAMVFVSHDIQTVRRMSDRVITMYLGRIVEETPADRVTSPPGRTGPGSAGVRARHPYTRALFSATPGLLEPVDPIPLTGPVPSATRPPSGCPFRTRCWKADEVCAAAMPDFSAASRTGHRYRCHHPVEEDQSTHDLARQER